MKIFIPMEIGDNRNINTKERLSNRLDLSLQSNEYFRRKNWLEFGEVVC